MIFINILFLSPARVVRNEPIKEGLMFSCVRGTYMFLISNYTLLWKPSQLFFYKFNIFFYKFTKEITIVLFILEPFDYILHVKFDIFFYKFTKEISRLLFILEPFGYFLHVKFKISFKIKNAFILIWNYQFKISNYDRNIYHFSDMPSLFCIL